MSSANLIMNARAIQRALARMAAEAAECDNSAEETVVVGIQCGGAELARRFAGELGRIWQAQIPVGLLDVTFHRDDLDQKIAPEVAPTVMPFDVNGKTVILVDDVLFRGRTVRAALDALADFGRPKSVQLAALIDRGHRQLPIMADFVGREVETKVEEEVEVRLGSAAQEDSVYLLQP